MVLVAANQVEVPDFMYGTAWKKEKTTSLVEAALEAGFTAIDTANQLKHYDEERVGEALLAAYKRGVKRESLFLQTKFTSLDGQDHRLPYDPAADLTTQVHQSMDSSLKHLHTDHVDSYVLHGPHTRHGLTAADWEVWAAIEGLYKEGKTRLIGVSNVTSGQLSLLCEKAVVKPMVVQNRCFAVMGWDHDVRSICRKYGIIYQGFSLLTANIRFVESATVRSIADEIKATTAQVIFKFSKALGMLPLTGTTSKEHMLEDLKADEVELSDSYVNMIESIALGQ